MSKTPKNALHISIKPTAEQSSRFHLDLDLKIPNSGVTALFGPSGSGKTTLLRFIAGLEKGLEGELTLFGNAWQNNKKSLPSHKRPIGYVFQEANLFPHLTAQQNLDFAIQRANKGQSVISDEEVIKQLNIEEILTQYPSQLSGGESQRVAIARALLIQPKLLLMDEPLAALDEALKQEILPYLEKLCHQASIPIIYVSHSLDEVIRLSDYMIVLEKGRVLEQGKTQALLATLNSSFSAHQDASVVITGSVVKESPEWGLSWIKVHDQQIVVQKNSEQIGDSLRLRIQSKDVSLSLSRQEDSSILNRLSAHIDDMCVDPKDVSMVMVRLLVGDIPIMARITALSAHNLALTKGQSVIAQIKSVALLR